MTRREKRSRPLESQESSEESKEKNVTRVGQEDLRRAIGEMSVDCKVSALCVVTPEDPQRFRDSLATMGLEGLLNYPWTVTFPGLIREIAMGKEIKLRTKGELTLGQVAKVYSLRGKGSSWLKSRNSWNGYFREEDFSGTQGWKPEHCLNDELKQIFKFLTPILSPGRQRHVTKKLAATVIASYTHEVKIDWASILLKVICRQLDKLPTCTTTRVSTYLAHIYYSNNALDDREKKNYEAANDHWYQKAVVLERPLEHGSNREEEPNDEDEDNAVRDNPVPGRDSRSKNSKQGEQPEASKRSQRSKKTVRIGPDPPLLLTRVRRRSAPSVLLDRIKKDVDSIYPYAAIVEELTNILKCDSSAILRLVRTQMDDIDSLNSEVSFLQEKIGLRENRTSRSREG